MMNIYICTEHPGDNGNTQIFTIDRTDSKTINHQCGNYLTPCNILAI